MPRFTRAAVRRYSETQRGQPVVNLHRPTRVPGKNACAVSPAGRARQMLLATSYDAMQLKQRGSKMGKGQADNARRVM